MMLIPLNTFFYVSDVENHHLIKNMVLDSVESNGVYSIDTIDQKITNTDWHLSPTVPRSYWKYLDNAVNVHNRSVADISKFKNARVINYWFQRYEKGDFHGWHTHGDCMFSNVYYAKLPNKEIKTSFRLHGEEFNFDVKEGQILTFPSCFQHMSPENTFDESKVVVAFNTVFGS